MVKSPFKTLGTPSKSFRFFYARIATQASFEKPFLSHLSKDESWNGNLLMFVFFFALCRLDDWRSPFCTPGVTSTRGYYINFWEVLLNSHTSKCRFYNSHEVLNELEFKIISDLFVFWTSDVWKNIILMRLQRVAKPK